MLKMTTLAGNLVFPECPRWHNGSFWFSDCHDGKVLKISPGGELLENFDMPGGPSGLGWLPGGDMLIVSIGGLCVYRRGTDGDLRRHADLSAHHRFHTNDMVVDATGNAYIGEVGFRWETEAPRSTCLLLVREDGSVQVAADDLMTPNGTVITADGRTLIVAESRLKRLTAFSIGIGGKLHDRRVFAQLGPDSVPDGICLDEDGAIWFASPRERAVIRVNSAGEVTDKITTDGLKPYACMLGGTDRRDLFICLSGSHDPEETRRARSGAIAMARVTVAGTGHP